MKHTRHILITIFAGLALCLVARRLSATEAWTPSTGDVNLDERTKNKPHAEFKHAAALLASGEPQSAARELAALVKKHPDAEWNENARYLLGMAHFNSGHYRSAFATWQKMQKKYPDNHRRDSVYEMQRKALDKLARDDLDDALALFDQLIDIAPTQTMGAQTQKAKADALFERHRYLHAGDQYLALVDYFPGSPQVPYAWYRIGVCHLEMARWIGRGTDQLDLAIRRLEDFLANFPDHPLVPKAREKLEEAQRLRTKKYARIAEYYMGPAHRPSGALPYLEYMADTMPKTEKGEWAEREISEVIKSGKPPRGRVKPISLPGVVSNNKKEATAQ